MIAGENLAFAKSIFQKSMNMINDKINNPEKYKPDYIDDVGDFKKQIKYCFGGDEDELLE